jgi:hypothetical protein
MKTFKKSLGRLAYSDGSLRISQNVSQIKNISIKFKTKLYQLLP